GRLIFFTDADLPYDLSFFDGAAKKLAQGFDLVTGNRRLPTSHFDVPVSLLPLAYKRHRLGLAFNWMARRLFPLQTTDTQAGIKAMSRRLALRAFSLQACPGFFFDLELFLTARGYGMRATELPVTLFLNSEKSSVRVLKESVLAGVWLARISWRSFRKAYGPGPRPPKILARYPRTRWSTRFFLSVRWKLTPYSQMAHELPERGPILDMGCGHGLFTLALALQSSERQVLGFDHDEDRVGLAREAARDLPNIDVRSGNMTEPPPGNYSGIAMIDVMHYFEPETQKELARQAFERLDEGGRLIVREVDPSGGAASSFNRFYEKIATGIGFTRAEKKGLHFRTRMGWEELFRSQGFEVKSKPCSSFLFADILYVCERPGSATSA
ncbi:MAG: methyltransferase domain-containing protein, partial [Bdellovibrionota bacterium]